MEGTDDYSPHADTQWLTVPQIIRHGVTQDGVREAVDRWEAMQIPTPPRSTASVSTSVGERSGPSDDSRRYLCKSCDVFLISLSDSVFYVNTITKVYLHEYHIVMKQTRMHGSLPHFHHSSLQQ